MTLRDRLLEPQGVLRGALFQDLLRTRLADRALMPGARVGAWRIVRELGRGGMGQVYLAERCEGDFEQTVALKWLPDAAQSPTGEALFRRERQVLAGLSHPNIARLVDGGHTDDGHPWFAMEYVQGLPIDRHAQANALNERARVALLLPVLRALEFAHSRLVIHRDIKPGNVLVDPQGQAKLLDFGIAGLAQDEEQATAFTPGFASPEQRAMQPVGTPSDVWQLGRLLDAVVRAGKLREPCKDLLAVIGMATQDDPARRYPTVTALKYDLIRYLELKPVAARQAGYLYRLGRMLRRHPIGTVGVALATLAATALVTGFVVYAAQERSRLRLARDETAAVNDFLSENILAASDPFEGRDHDQPIADTLDEGIEAAESRFREHPGTAGRILVALGKGLISRGRYAAAERAADRAIVLLGGADGTSARAIADARLLRATVDMYRGFPERAQARLDELQAAFPYRVDAPSSMEWRIQAARGWNAMLRNRYAECIATYTGILERPGAVGGSELGDAYSSLSVCQTAAGYPAQALLSGERAAGLTSAASGPRSGNAVVARIRIAVALGELGRHRESTRRFQREVETLIDLLGEQHGVTAAYMDHLAVLYLCGDDPVPAEAWAARSLSARKVAFGPRHTWSIGTQAVYAVALLRSGEVERARPVVAEIEQLQGLAEDPGSQVWVYRALGEWYLRARDFDKAIAYYRATRRLAAQPGMEARWNLHVVDGALALALSQAGRPDEARAAYARYDASTRYANRCVSTLSRDVELGRAKLRPHPSDRAGAPTVLASLRRRSGRDW